MFDEFEKEDDQWRPDEPKAWKIIKKSLGWTCVALAFLFIGFLLVRMFSSYPPRAMKKAVWDDALLAAYNEKTTNKEELQILQIPTSDAFSENGMFSLYTITYTPSIKQLQLTVRYNDRVLNYLAQDYPEVKNAAKDAEIYTYSLAVTRGENEKTTEIIDTYRYTCDHRAGYTYRRLIFDNVDLEGMLSIYIRVAYSGAPTEIRHSIRVHDNTVYKTVNELPLFSYSAPKGKTKGIKSK